MPTIVPVGIALQSYTPGTLVNAIGFGSVTFTCTAAPTTPYAFDTSPDGTTLLPVSAIDGNFSIAANLAAVGTFTVAGGGFVGLAGGAGGTFTVAAGS